MLESWTEDQRDLRQGARDVARGLLTPAVAKLESAPAEIDAIVPELAELGFLGLGIEEDAGGMGADFLSRVLVVEVLAEASPSVGYRVAQHILPASFGVRGEESALREAMAGGDRVAAFSRVVNCGDDVLAAVGDPQVFVCSGAVWLGRSDGGKTTRRVPMLGLGGVDFRELHFESVFSAKAQDPHGTLAVAELAMCAVALGTAQAALAAGGTYAKEREQFGRPIAEFQAIQFKIADMAMAVEVARRMTYELARQIETQSAKGPIDAEFATRALHVRRFVAEQGIRTADHALQIHGGYGYTREFPVERLLRGAKMLVPRSAGKLASAGLGVR